ncbi:DNA primase small subunit [Trypanosoma conorhini]|uniref:DNA primase small subunit n=1 Tax=Trypanosoma conorhini TaxID=83891 RepID=A0A422NI65_9TRYP|nr:DNA primase small subunit [Trypanosoma conorhini]RNF05170.1 DNA primase small subunit [Trypanosoma conorhini]
MEKGCAGAASTKDELRQPRPRQRQPPRRQNPIVKHTKGRNTSSLNDPVLDEAPQAAASATSQLPEAGRVSEGSSHVQSVVSCGGITSGGISNNGGYRLAPPHVLVQQEHTALLAERDNCDEAASCLPAKSSSECDAYSLPGHSHTAAGGVPAEDGVHRTALSKEERERVPELRIYRNSESSDANELLPIAVASPMDRCSEAEVLSTSLNAEQQRQQPPNENEEDKENEEHSHIQRTGTPSVAGLPGMSVRPGNSATSPPFPDRALMKSHSSSLRMSVPTSTEKEEREEGDVFSLWGIHQQQQQQQQCDTQIDNSRYGCQSSSISSQPESSTYRRQRSYNFTPEVSLSLCRLVDENVVASLSQTVERMMPQRQRQLVCVAKYLTEAIAHEARSKGVNYGSLRYYVFGSVAMCTVLPDGDNDVTIDVEGILNPSKILERGETFVDPQSRAVRSESSSSSHNNNNNHNHNENDNSDSNNNTTTNNNNDMSLSQAAVIAGGELLSAVAEYLRQRSTPLYVDALVLAEVRVLKLVMEGSCFDITVGQLGGVECVRFLHEMDVIIGSQHLLQRTLLLLKAWCCYEAHILTGQGGYLSSYAATIMLIAMMNTVEFLEDVDAAAEKEDEDESKPRSGQQEPFKNVSPLQLFSRFLKFFSYFDFERYCVTVFGPLPHAFLKGTSLDLTRLEFSEGSGDNRGEPPNSPKPETKESAFEEVIDVNVLGLTAEGARVFGHCLRRRAKPLITVNGVRHILYDEHIRRQHVRTKSRGLQHEMGGMESASGTPGNGIGDVEQLPLNSSGEVPGDANFPCSNLDTSHFPLRTMNVMDPLRWSASLCRGVSRNHLQRIRRAFREGLALFERGSTIIGDASFSSCAEHSEGSDASWERSSRTGEHSAIVLDPVKLVVEQRNRLESINGVLKDLFGHTLAILRRHISDSSSLMHPQQVQCRRCPRPSFFCASHLKQMCEPQCVFDLHDTVQNCRNEHDAVGSRARGTIEDAKVSPFPPNVLGERNNSHYHHQQRQNQQQQLQMLSSSGSMLLGTGPMLSTLPPNPNVSLRFVPSVCGMAWQCSDKQLNRDSCMNQMAIAQHLARGAPLLRPRTKVTSLLGGQRVPQVGGVSNSNLCPADSAAFQCYPGFPTAGTLGPSFRTPIEHNALDGAPTGFVPLPLPPPPPPPSVLVSSPSLSDTRYQTATLSQKPQGASSRCVASHSYLDVFGGGIYPFHPPPVDASNLVDAKNKNGRLF